MTDPIRFHSTNGDVTPVFLGPALLQGQAADRGLFMPERFPNISTAELAALTGKPYADVATAVLSRYMDGMIDNVTLKTLCDGAYDYPVPLEHVTERRHLLRLDRGPTAHSRTSPPA